MIFWGSQSGRAEGLARRLAISLQTRFGLRASAVDLDDYDHDGLTQLTDRNLCGFILSTYGDGDPPDNTNGLWDALRTLQLNGAKLDRLGYVLFGLGNSNYRQYNRVAEVVDSTLQALCARRHGQVGYGDDANGETETGFLLWRECIEQELKMNLELTEQPYVYRPVFDVEEHHPSVPLKTLHLGEPAGSRARLLPGQMMDTSSVSAIPIDRIYRLWESDDRLCLHLDLALGENRLVKYKTGDHMAVWPSNPDHEVERTLAALGLLDKRKTRVDIKMIDKANVGRVPVPTPTTIEALFRYYLEICGALSMETVGAFAEFAPSEVARTRLRRITGDPEVFKADVVGARMTLADVLETVSPDAAWTVPLSFLLERLKAMQPRYYSISSSTIVYPRKLSLTVVVSKPPRLAGDPTAPPRGCHGLTTSYLRAIERCVNSSGKETESAYPSLMFSLDGPRGLLSGSKVFGRVCRSAFKLPPKASTPIIMIGAGTGVAPFRAFVQERARQGSISQEVGKTLLFMGFRNSKVDFIYEDEWRQWRESLGTDTFDYWTAFSREDPSRKLYVQDVLAQQAEGVCELLESNFASRIYICGSAEMARGCTTALASMRSQFTGKSQDQGLSWVKQLRQTHRLLEDVWS